MARPTFILVFYGNLVVTLQLAPEDTLHHQHQLIVGDVFIMDRDASDVITQLGFNDQLPAQVQLAVHGAVRPVLLPPLKRVEGGDVVKITNQTTFLFPSVLLYYHFLSHLQQCNNMHNMTQYSAGCHPPTIY